MRSYSLSHLTNPQLLAEAERLAGVERRCAAELVLHIAEIEAGQLHLARGFPSMYVYCTEVLGLSDFEALARIEAARAGQRFPRIFDMLLDGSLSLTSAQLVARRLTPENCGALLADAAGKTKKEIQLLLARWFPQPAVPATIRKLPMPAGITPSSASVLQAPPYAPVAVVPEPPSSRARVAPRAPNRYKVTFTADEETTELLELAKQMLSHAVPSGDTAEGVNRAFKALVSDLARRKFAAAKRRRNSRGPKDPCDVPADVKQEVWIRDGGRCAFIGTTGRRCGSRWQVEFGHVDERCNRGKGTAKNIQLRCAAHNRHEAHFEDGRPKRAPVTDTLTRSGPSTVPRPSSTATALP